eukprot:m51a1_g7263 hypothetical protein (458) ;mRNA; f:195357-197436
MSAVGGEQFARETPGQLEVVKPSDPSESMVRYHRSIAAMSAGFLLLFTCYYIVQNLQTQVNKTSGWISLGIVYVSFSLMSFVSGAVVHVAGERAVMFASTFGYVFFVGANIRVHAPLLYASALAAGVCAALLWVSCGSYLTRASVIAGREELYATAFMLCFSLSTFTSNLIAALVQELSTSTINGSSEGDSGYDFTGLFVACTVLAFVSAFVFLLLAPLPDAGDEERSLRKDLAGSVAALRQLRKLMLQPRMALLMPMFAAMGCDVGFAVGVLPALIDDTRVSSWALAASGVVYIVVSAFYARISRAGRGVLAFLIIAFALIAGLVLCVPVASQLEGRAQFWVFMCAGAMFGFPEPGLSVQFSLVFERDFAEDELTACNCALHALEAIGFAVAFFAGIWLSSVAMAFIVGGVQVVALACVLVRAAALKLPSHGYYDSVPEGESQDSRLEEITEAKTY